MRMFEGWDMTQLRMLRNVLSDKFRIGTCQEVLDLVTKEIRNRRIQEELSQMKLNVSLEAIEEE